MRRNTTLAIGLVVVMAAAGGGWAAGRNIRSPAEVAARTAPPTASLIAVPVEKRTLSSDVVARGTMRYGAPQPVALPASALKPANAIVTVAPAKGATVKEGSVALAVTGRPVFVLQGNQPAYRDMAIGAVGEDVRQLEQALARLGFDPGPVDGSYDDATAKAVAAWYAAAGWAPFGPTPEQLLAQKTAVADAFQAQSDLLSAKEAVATARTALTLAEQQARTARVTQQGAPGAEATATATAARERAVSAADIATRTSAVQAALDEQRVAQLRVDEAKANPPANPSDMAALENALHQATRAFTVAQAELAAAQATAAALAPAPMPGAIVDEATRAADQAAAAAAAAAASLDLAKQREALVARRADAVKGPAIRLGVQVPADEVLFFPSLPRRIDDVKVRPGDPLSGAVMTVSNSQLAVDSALTASDAKLVHTGATVAIDDPDLGIHATGSVTAVAETPGTNGVDPQRFYLQVTPAGAATLPVGASVVLTITVASTGGDVLTVPIAALSVAADGSSRVQVQAANRSTHDITVTPGLTAKGLVAVTPVGGRLAAGDLVVVGTNNPAGAGKASPTTTATSATTAASAATATTTSTAGGTRAP